MHIRRGVYLRVAERLQFKSYSRLSKIIFIATACLIVLASSIALVKNTLATPPCPCTVFTPQTPAVAPALYNEAGGIEVGMRFKVSQPGYISGARFYKVAGMAGVHTASIWSSLGNRLATATFSSESAAGWQEISFAPIAVTTGPAYTVSVFMADGNYAASSNYFNVPIVNEPLSAPQDGQAWDGLGHSNQGVYDASGVSAYPNGSFNATNYWVDTVYVSSTSQMAPTVTAKYPAAGATNVTVSDAVTATFDKSLNPSTVSSSTFIVKDAQGTIVPGVVTYDQATSLVKFVGDAVFQTNTTYTVTVKGGGGNGISDYDGHNFGADYEWSFTTSSTPLVCPCSLKNTNTPTGATTYNEYYSNGLELGLKIVPSANGYITAIRFYKALINEQMSHVGHVWDGNGNSLATVTSNNESDYGWQEATLATPLSVVKDRVYIVSFGLPTGKYVATMNGLASTLASPGFAAYPSGEPRNAALGSGTANSVYASIAGVYPSSPVSNHQDYMIDAVFSLQSTENLPLRIMQTQPSTDSIGIKRDVVVRATFDQAIDPLTLTANTVFIRNSSGVLISSQVGYDPAKRALTIDPTSNLTAGEKYTATITTGVKDVRGKYLPTEHQWSFTAGTSSVIDMNQGNGGPILVATAAGDNYGKYYAEILRTEGMNYFDVQDINSLTATDLHKYASVVLSPSSLTQAQVDMFQSWVTDGGNLVAMRPDKKLAGFLGLEDVGATMASAYLKVDPATTPGLGIVSETMQYKGTADKYTANGATVVASLYSDAATATSYPAVTTRSVGAGVAMSFSYDLARSVIGLHQGNQLWANQDRNNDGTDRTNDLFHGAAAYDPQPDWLDSSKMAIPQADEQQRILANLLTDAMRKTLPAPRFWYLPNDQKVALVFAGDDHNLSDVEGSQKQLNELLNKNYSDCSLMDWQCVRATHYVYANSALSSARGGQFAEYGFEIGSHPIPSGGNCGTAYSYNQLVQDYADALSSVQAKYSNVPHQRTVRFHCYAWPSWDWMPKVDYLNGVRYDLNTVAYPVSWVSGRSPMVTGSGMNMRLSDASGSLLDVRQGVTNFDNTSANPTAIAAMFDNALGAKGYYGIFGSHYDMSDLYNDTLYNVAASRQIPIITADQALTWLDGRSGSNFRDLTSSEIGKVTFSIDVAEGAYGLQAMMPLQDAEGALSSIKRAGQSVAYRTEIIKGVHYAIFTANPGAYEVLYTDFSPKTQVVTDDTSVGVTASSRGYSAIATDEEPATNDKVNNVTSRPTKGLPAHQAESPSDGIVDTPKTWWPQPIVFIVGGGITATSGVIWWLFKLRRRIF
jgi:hypothetical protein